MNVAIPSVIIAIAGISISAYLYLRPKNSDEKIKAKATSVYSILYHKFYIDEIYLWVTHTILFKGIARAANWFDHRIIDGSLHALTSGTESLAESVKGMQSGRVQRYGAYMLIGVLAMFLLIIYIIS